MILSGGDLTRLDEVDDLLQAVELAVEQQSFMRDVVFRFLLASARVAHLRHDPDAQRLARTALSVAAETAPSLPRHPDVGRPSATTDQIAELERIAGLG